METYIIYLRYTCEGGGSKMRRWAIIFFVLLTLVGCSNARSSELEKEITNCVRSGQLTFELSHLTKFHWTKAYLFTPYTTVQMIEEEIGIPFKDTSKLSERDDIELLVFVDEEQGEVVQTAQLKRLEGTYSFEKGTYATPENDTLFFTNWESNKQS